MMRFNPFAKRPLRPEPLIIAALVVALGTGIVACSDTVAPSDDADAAEEPSARLVSVHDAVDKAPRLKGRIMGPQRDFEYPEAAKQAGITGRVFVQFVVDENGNVQDPRVKRGAHDLLDEAAIEAIQRLEFEPAMDNGTPVRVQRTIPIAYRLDEVGPYPNLGATPPSRAPAFEKEGLEQLLVTIEADGSVRVDGKAVPLSDLTAAVQDRLTSDSEQYVAIRVSPHTTPETAQHADDLIRAGTSRISHVPW